MRPEDLYDIVEPAPAAFVIGWWLMAMVLLAVMVFAVLMWRRQRRWRWQQQLARCDTIGALNLVLKACATAHGHADVMPLWGDDWWHWLQRRLSPRRQRALQALAVVADEQHYAAQRPPSADEIAAARHWLRHARLGVSA